MAILVDAAIWPWRGRRWAHMISDTSHDELHEFAVSIGKRRVAFQGDHYDVDTEERERALRRGARAVDARDIVRALRSSGLRVRPGHSEGWEWIASRVEVRTHRSLSEVFGPLGVAGERASGLAAPLLDELGRIEVSAFARPGEIATMLAVEDEDLRQRSLELASAVLGNELDRWFVAGHGPFVAELLHSDRCL